MSKLKEFKVGVFEQKGKRKTKYCAYTEWYNKDWPGCTEYIIMAENGAEAKKKAIEIHKNKK